MAKASAGAAKKKKGKKRTITPADLVEFMLSHTLMRDLPESTLTDLAAGKVEFVEVGAEDEVVRLAANREEASPLFVVLKGELSVSEGSGDEREFLNVVPHGEVFFDRALDPNSSKELGVVAMQPTELLKIGYDDANTLLQQDAAFKDRFMGTLQQSAARRERFFEAESLKDITGFLTENRLVGINRLKVKRLDKCIDCDGCFEACANRHGVSRLGDYKSRFGLIGVPYNCHNCESPGCIPRCKFGHIGYAESGEIQISDNCTGCTQCFRGCSYGSITMVPIDSMPEGYLDRSPSAKGKQVARKCDDCTDFEDQACISACPTGAIFQVSSLELADYLSVFVPEGSKEDSGALDALKSAGVTPGAGVDEETWAGWRFVFMGVVAFISSILAWEGIGRGWLQGILGDWFSFSAALHDIGLRTGQPEQGAFALKPGNSFSLLLGYLGAFVMILSQLYRVRRSLGARMGSMQMWMQFHIYCGYLGGIFILFHALKPAWSFFTNKWFIIAFVPMLIAIITGVVGRYASHLLPKSRSGSSKDPATIDAEIKGLDEQIQALIKTPQMFEETVKNATQAASLNPDDLQALQNAAAIQQGLSSVSSKEAAKSKGDPDKIKWHVRILAAFKGIKAAFASRIKLRAGIKKLRADIMGMQGLNDGEKQQLVVLTEKRVELEQSRQGFDVFDQLQNSWRFVHTSASYLMFGTMMIHVLYEFYYLGAKVFRP